MIHDSVPFSFMNAVAFKEKALPAAFALAGIGFLGFGHLRSIAATVWLVLDVRERAIVLVDGFSLTELYKDRKTFLVAVLGASLLFGIWTEISHEIGCGRRGLGGSILHVVVIYLEGLKCREEGCPHFAALAKAILCGVVFPGLVGCICWGNGGFIVNLGTSRSTWIGPGSPVVLEI